jgi:hypothetical protein
MTRISKAVLYGQRVFWELERDKLNAHFCRFGCGFMTPNNVREALESTANIARILTQYQNSLTNTHTPPVEPSLLPMLEAQRSVPRYAH